MTLSPNPCRALLLFFPLALFISSCDGISDMRVRPANLSNRGQTASAAGNGTTQVNSNDARADFNSSDANTATGPENLEEPMATSGSFLYSLNCGKTVGVGKNASFVYFDCKLRTGNGKKPVAVTWLLNANLGKSDVLTQSQPSNPEWDHSWQINLDQSEKRTLNVDVSAIAMDSNRDPQKYEGYTDQIKITPLGNRNGPDNLPPHPDGDGGVL